jgi:hypothetical protein
VADNERMMGMMERTTKNLDELVSQIADAQLQARQLGLDDLAEALTGLARAAALVTAIEASNETH